MWLPSGPRRLEGVSPLPTFTRTVGELLTLLLAGALARRHGHLAGRLDARWPLHVRIRLLARATVLLRHGRIYSCRGSQAPSARSSAVRVVTV
jgi:hypothetical protein